MKTKTQKPTEKFADPTVRRIAKRDGAAAHRLFERATVRARKEAQQQMSLI